MSPATGASCSAPIAASIHKIRLKVYVVNIVAHMRYLEAIQKLCFAQVTHHDNPVFPYNLLHAISININLHYHHHCQMCHLPTQDCPCWHLAQYFEKFLIGRI